MAKYPDVTAGQTEACINRMGGWSNFLRFVAGQGELVFKSILTLLGTVMVEAQPKFLVREHFAVNTSDSAIVKIGYIWEDFIAWFNDLVEDEVQGTVLEYYKLEENSRADKFFGELGDTAIVKLSQIFALMRKQPKGEVDGELLVNGCANLFKVRDAKGELRVVYVYWRAGRGCWDVNADRLVHPSVWSAGSRVFSN